MDDDHSFYLDDVAREVREWQDRELGTNRVEGALALCEEAGEVARAVLKTKQGIRPETRGDVGDELGDVLMAALALADRHGLSAMECLQRRLGRLRTLTFKRGD